MQLLGVLTNIMLTEIKVGSIISRLSVTDMDVLRNEILNLDYSVAHNNQRNNKTCNCRGNVTNEMLTEFKVNP